MFKSTTVDSILSDFNKKVDQLNAIALKHNTKAYNHRAAAEVARKAAEDLDQLAEDQAAEAFRAVAVATKIKALIT